MNTKVQNISKIIGIIISVAGVADTIFESVQNHRFSFSLIAIILICVGLLVLFFSSFNVRYFIKKRWSYYSRTSDPYYIKYKEVRYTYLAPDRMTHKKKHIIVSRVHQLSSFNDKFKWSASIRPDEIKLTPGDDATACHLSREENWFTYTLDFPQMGKGQTRSISVFIDNLVDKNKEALPFLSTNINSKTRKFRLIVEFRDLSLHPHSAIYQIFDNYSSDYPILQKDLEFNEDDHRFEVIEEYPIYGYRYVIKWKF